MVKGLKKMNAFLPFDSPRVSFAAEISSAASCYLCMPDVTVSCGSLSHIGWTLCLCIQLQTLPSAFVELCPGSVAVVSYFRHDVCVDVFFSICVFQRTNQVRSFRDVFIGYSLYLFCLLQYAGCPHASPFHLQTMRSCPAAA